MKHRKALIFIVNMIDDGFARILVSKNLRYVLADHIRLVVDSNGSDLTKVRVIENL